ncbi:MAG: carboxypeptidase regulatory-like domain-containing protein [Deltaproteobacteria bacterium]|nr:carboxypeptidase regulatory-like domain-containing protein [Deltaproteobacteria bacterium]
MPPPFFMRFSISSIFISMTVFFLSAFPGYAGQIGIEGIVRYDGAAMAGAYLEVFSTPPDNAAKPMASAISGEGGVFIIPLPPGEYYLTARKRPNGGGAAGMLYGTSGADPIPVVPDRTIAITIDMGDRGKTGGLIPEGTDVTGRIMYLGKPKGGAYVYLYPGRLERGPNYLSRVRTGENGVFNTRVLPGLYSIKVRFTEGGDGMGTIQREDKVGEYPENPVEVGQETTDLGTIVLRDVDQKAWEKYHWAAGEGGITIHGRVTDEDGSSVEGVYAFLYSDRKMVGKPTAISAPTGPDGLFNVAVQRPGLYYLGARSRFGGPVEPGELMGAYDASGIKPVELGSGRQLPSYDIVVREVW